ncbi:MAG TPA: hypothetical protein VHW67_01620 [Solirubrobacteraceae bacterium]|jgi:hypothetical protein|nr:hypothetical protein [Solirubrobacteraceae bacterium]
MIYCVVPKPLADDLYPKLVKYYENEENVTVIVDRREFDRRARQRRTVARSETREDRGEGQQRRIVRDRRRARVPGDLPPLAQATA